MIVLRLCVSFSGDRGTVLHEPGTKFKTIYSEK